MSLDDAAHCLDELSAGRTPSGARLIAGALALDTLKLSGTTDRLLLDAAAGLELLATGRRLDLDAAGRTRAAEMAVAVRSLHRQLRSKAGPTIDDGMWRRGAIDGFQKKPVPPGLADNFSYSSGRVEGAAWRETRQDLNAKLSENRVAPYTEPGNG